MIKYETYDVETPTEIITNIKRINEDGSLSFIPSDPANSDYQAYLKWLENPNADWSEPQLTKF